MGCDIAAGLLFFLFLNYFLFISDVLKYQDSGS